MYGQDADPSPSKSLEERFFHDYKARTARDERKRSENASFNVLAEEYLKEYAAAKQLAGRTSESDMMHAQVDRRSRRFRKVHLKPNDSENVERLAFRSIIDKKRRLSWASSSQQSAPVLTDNSKSYPIAADWGPGIQPLSPDPTSPVPATFALPPSPDEGNEDDNASFYLRHGIPPALKQIFGSKNVDPETLAMFRAKSLTGDQYAKYYTEKNMQRNELDRTEPNVDAAFATDPVFSESEIEMMLEEDVQLHRGLSSTMKKRYLDREAELSESRQSLKPLDHSIQDGLIANVGDVNIAFNCDDMSMTTDSVLNAFRSKGIRPKELKFYIPWSDEEWTPKYNFALVRWFLERERLPYMVKSLGPVPFSLRPMIRTCADDFVWLRTIGMGAYGRVRLVQAKHNEQLYAIKEVSKKKVVKLREVEHLNSERLVLAAVWHPNVIHLWSTFSDEKHLYFVMDYAPGGDLFGLLHQVGRLPERAALFYTAEVAMALEHLHLLNILYRDLKPENVLIAYDGHIQLADMGLSRWSPDASYTVCGTRDYMAPETIRGNAYTKSVDWYAFGVLIYELLVGHTPFYSAAPDSMASFRNILEGTYEIPLFVSPCPASLIERLVIRHPEARLGSGPQGAQEVMCHAWFESVDWKALYYRVGRAPYIPAEETYLFDKNKSEPDVSRDDSLTPRESYTSYFDGFPRVH